MAKIEMEMPKKNEVLYHLDRNYQNNELSNLKVVPRAIISIMAVKKRHNKNKGITNSNLLLSELELKIKRKIKRKYV